MEQPVKTGKKRGTKPGEKIVTRQMRFDLLQTMKHHGFDPLDRLLELYDEAHELFEESLKYGAADWVVNSRWQMKMTVADKLMEYVYPKRKAIELSGQAGDDMFKSFVDVVKLVRSEMNENPGLVSSSNDTE